MQSTINKIVEQFYSGKKGSVARASALYKDAIFAEEEGAREDPEDCGTVIPNKRMNFDKSNAHWLEGHATAERIEALSNGARPTEPEKQAYRECITAEVEDGTADADDIPGYWIYKLQHSDGREVFALETVLGYADTGVRNEFHGMFPSVAAAKANLARWGLVVSD